MKLLSRLFFVFILFFSGLNVFSQVYKVIESGTDHIIVEFNLGNSYSVVDTTFKGKTFQKIHGEDHSVRNPGDPWTPEFTVLAGMPFDSKPSIKIIEHRQSVIKNKFLIPFPEEDPTFVKQDFEKINKEIYSKNELFPASPAYLGEIYVVRHSSILPITLAPYQFNPVTRDLIFNSYILVRVDFNLQNNLNIMNLNDSMTDEFLETSVINPEIARSFTGRVISGDSPFIQNSYWYNPNKNYFKIYVKEKDVYRMTYEELISSGVQLGSNISISKLELFNDGLPVPIDVYDNNIDSIFNAGDYMQFVGYPPSVSPYCKVNIYNLSNVYWFSYQSDSSGVNYDLTPSFVSNYSRSYFANLTTIHFEKDSLYERLGHALNDNRDFWFWDKATSRTGQPFYIFNHYFDRFPTWFYPDSAYVRLKIAMQGMTTYSCPNDHKAYIKINGKIIGDVKWDAQNNIVFNKRFYASPDSIPIYLGNQVSVEVRGDLCTAGDDEIRINWIEFEYWRGNSAFGKYYNFKNYDTYGINRYAMFDWQGDDVRIYIPAKSKMMYLPDPGSFQQFVDTMRAATEYFLAASDYSSSVDSIVADDPSNLRNISNGADYIIITHKNFSGIADQLASLRQNNFPDENIPNPRIEIVDVQQIYDEFSYGLLEPKSLTAFVKYAFENWESPAPSYIVLLGDMSYDYRALLESSRPNFIPSIPYFTSIGKYGQAASDNLIVAVAGDDAGPDLALGRLSIETVAEGNILLQKLTDYPDDATKPWKQNVLMLASGLDLQDEQNLQFNDASLFLGNQYVIPQGFYASYVFRFPWKAEHYPYQGEGPKIREEINKGAVLVNYYGHGGGYQWDLVFTNDDIYLLENEGRLPFISSVTCYTAHFDNQDVFGEQFNKVPGKGSIGFYGSSGLTLWYTGTDINRELFNEIFKLRNYITGKAIMNSKNRFGGGVYESQINLLTYLGDPVLKLALPNFPDFELKSNGISLIPENPIVGDSIQVKLNISNWGAVFPNDSVVVELYANLPDTAYQIGLIKRPSFSEKDSVYFPWIPDKGGQYTLTAKVNETEIILEEDHSDNIAVAYFIIFNINEPSILTPIDGFVSKSNQIEFVFSDIGYYIPKELEYYIQIDTSINFISPLYSSEKLTHTRSLTKWNSPNLPEGIYYWRARMFDGTDFGNWSPVRSFSIMSINKDGYYAHAELLKTFSLYNMNYLEASKSLVLNTEPLPARPSSKTFEKIFIPNPQIPDTLNLTTITTDGTYIYCANAWFYARELTDGMSMIYRIGTGYNGTVEGQYYGSFSDFRDSVFHSIVYHSDGYLYVAIGDPYKIIRINTFTEVIDTVGVPPGLIRDNSTISKGPQYLSSDGRYIYNLSYVDSLLRPKYNLRTFDPSNGWLLAKPDIELFGISFYPGFCDFFVHGERIYTTEIFSNFLRRYRLSDGYYEEEFIATDPPPSNFKNYFAWCWDWQNDNIYASVFKYADPTVVPKFGKFAGYYIDANGTVTTKTIGPVAWWNSLNYDLYDPSASGEYTTILTGQNSSTKEWDTLLVNLKDSVSLSEINSNLYPYLRLKFDLTDSTFATTEPMELKSVQFDYQPLSDIYVEREDFNFQQDSLLQGYPVTFDFKARNFGNVAVDSVSLSFTLNGLDSIIFKPIISIPADSFSILEHSIETNKLLFENNVSVFSEINKREYFYFNNLTDQEFFVARDSVPPVFSVKFDGQEIIDKDIVSSTPEVVITLEDNSPLEIDTSFFTMVHTYKDKNISKVLRFYQPEITHDYQGPGSPFTISWKPTLEDGEHILEVLAKDASGNFFDSTSYSIIFYVYNENDISDVYNYPNPFARTTHFTFILKGNNKPDEVDIKIYTIAGRLIRDIKLSPSQLITNFNKVYWDGRDEDGDEVGNGVYLYNVIAKFPDKTKTITQKLAKVR